MRNPQHTLEPNKNEVSSSSMFLISCMMVMFYATIKDNACGCIQKVIFKQSSLRKDWGKFIKTSMNDQNMSIDIHVHCN